MIDAVIKEFNDLVGESFGVNWGSDDVTKSTVYAQYEYEDICETYETDEFKKAIKELTLKDGFYVERCMQVYLDTENTEESKKKLEAFYPIEVENVKKYISKFNKNAKYWDVNVDIEDIEDNCGWQFLEFVHYGLTDDTIEQLKNYLQKEEKGDGTMKIDKCYIDFDENGGWAFVNGVLIEGFSTIRVGLGEVYFDGCGCSIPIDNVKKGDFYIAERDKDGYPKNEQDFSKWVFEENQKCLDALADSILGKDKTKALLDEIMEESDHIIELSGCPVEEKPNNMFSEETGLQPQGDFAYMVEFFSTSLVCQDDDDYVGCFSKHDYNGKYIKDAMALINDVEKRAEKLANKYAEKGVKVTVNGFNEGCQYGLAVYVWIPYQ